MSGSGRPDIQALKGAGVTVGIVATRWNAEVVDALLDRATAAAEACDITPTVVRVSGAMEVPVVAQHLAREHAAVVCLAAVIRGGTPHFEYVCRSVTDGLTRVALDAGTPVGNGVLTCDTLEQGLDRCGLAESHEDKGWEATMAAVEAAVVLRDLRHRVPTAR
ncbi:MAG: 6,7-dimethyl-8-ribityllumazine synthase [Streptosporangiales bacterium]|nr:6,7-dimethyl-8-ribityllumazine synthase [Streptosporangiales bacterium]